ncbi:HNH endonuclease [Halomonas litopenaei]|uniref:HNH endonuclease n=1 Tax=Halomonas litopenaei TaxID=2109328 RepID=UPI001A8DC4F2|nr:HNH endonuclease [Halomonas litopenaei]MBN8413978.1 HNH endonuclease [Halomonas litopenaei]
MPVNFDSLEKGERYERPQLSEHWGFKSFQAISRGVVTPKDSKFIVLFVTKEKQSALTQYHDHIEGNRLYWEGERKHGSDNRIVSAHSNGDEIHLFYRDIHHSPFEYFGEIFLEEFELLENSPSRFVFTFHYTVEQNPFIDVEAHSEELDGLESTERQAIISSRVGQGAFRAGVISLWRGCAVTGVKKCDFLRASHIKPWRESSNAERLDPMNGLLLTPTLDHLFDAGFISFDDGGQMLISLALSENDARLLHVNSEMKLSKIPEEVRQYLRYHRDQVFLGE